MDEELFTLHIESEALDDLKKGLQLAQDKGAKSLMLLTCSQNQYCEQSLTSFLNSFPLPVFGGMYPMITHQATLYKQGALIVGFKEVYQTSLFSNLDKVSDEDELEEFINIQLEKNEHFNHQDDFLMFYDGLMTNIENFIDCLFDCLDHSISIAGGGAGYLDFIQRPCVFTNTGIYSNSVLLVCLPSKITTSIAHGWQILEGPFLASEVHEQTVQSLNYQPAFDVYSQAIESKSHYKFDRDNFYDITKNFPLGIEDINNNLIVRDPVLAINGHLQCIGKIAINSMVYLLHGSVDDLINAAEDAAIKVSSNNKDVTQKASMMFDCVSRVLYMEEKYNEELEVISKHNNAIELFGVLSIGEIANGQSGALSLLNRSIVISTW
jgi:hypothetical protein